MLQLLREQLLLGSESGLVCNVIAEVSPALGKPELPGYCKRSTSGEASIPRCWVPGGALLRNSLTWFFCHSGFHLSTK